MMMRDDRMPDRDNFTPSPDTDLAGLEWALPVLREEVTISAQWRAGLDRAVHEAAMDEAAEVEAADVDAAVHAQPASHRRGWFLTPPLAMAAALTCMVLGGLSGTVIQSYRSAASGSDTPSPSATNAEAPAVSLRDAAFAGEPVVGVRFSVMAPGVRRVSVVGDFNLWDAAATPLHRSRDGVTWSALLPMTTGRHVYAFVIDGEVVADPAAPRAREDDFGVPNSLLIVGSLP